MVDEIATPSRVEAVVVSRREIAMLLGVIGFALVVYLVFLDPAAGLFADDAWYALLGKALATGQGYQIINSPTPGIFPLYPPFYPVLLSFVIRLFPDFPENVTALKSVSIVAMMALGVIGFFYFRRHRGTSTNIALIIVLLAMFCQPLMFLATSTLMSECVFALLVVALIAATERLVSQVRAGSSGWSGATGSLLLVVAISSAAFLTRSIAVTLIAGVVLYLLKEGLFRQAAIFVLLFGLVAGSWTLYAQSKLPTPEQRLEQGGNIIMTYGEAFWQKTAGVGTSGQITWRELPERVVENFKSVVGPNVLQIVAPPLFRWFSQLRRDYQQATIVLQIFVAILLSLLILTGYISQLRSRVTAAEIGMPLTLGLILVWPFAPLRFLAPLAPFIFFYLISGIGAIGRRLRPETEDLTAGRIVTIAASIILLLSIGGHTWTLVNRQGAHLTSFSWSMAFEDNEKVMHWIRQSLPPSEVLISNNPALVTLFTGHKTIGLDLTPERWEMFRRMKLRYVVLHRSEGNTIPALRNFIPVYRVRNGQDYRVLDLGPAETRPPLTR